MSELTLVGLHEDGEHVVLADSEGHQYRVHIDEALRAAVRRDRPHLELARARQSAQLPPREIQSRIRAGASAEEVAQQSGTPLDVVRRYEGPVLAEREFVTTRAQGIRIGGDVGSPELGDLVTDRLASRGVGVETIRWDAFRRSGRPWTVEVRFQGQHGERSATWTYDAAAGRVHALDDDARWLSETELPDEPVRRRLTPVRDRVFDVERAPAQRPAAEGAAEPATKTDALLADLNGRRGVRQELDPDGEDDLPAFGPRHGFDFGEDAAAHPSLSRPEEAADATVLSMPNGQRTETEAQPAPDGPSRTTKRGRKGRASVPSWDEIVFGARPDL